MTRLPVLALWVMALPASAQIRPAPELGLWESQSRIVVNGRDVMGEMRDRQAKRLEKMPPERRAQFEAMMKAQGAGMTGLRQECLVAKDLDKWSRPEARLREAEKDARHCTFEPVATSGSTLQFKGKCADPEGFTGDVAGTFTMQGSKAWTFVYTGQGQTVRRARPGQEAAAAPMEMRVETNARWVSSQCGAVQPRP
jgi:hypothetical protein